MPARNPLPANYRADAVLTDYSVSYGQEQGAFGLGGRAATIKRVKNKSDKYPVYSKADMFRSEMKKVPANSPSPISSPRMSLDNYNCDVWKLKTFLADEDRDDADADLRLQKTRYLTNMAGMARVSDFATNIFATGKWTANTEQTGVAAGPGANEFLQFNDTSSDPVGVIGAQRLVVRTSGGLMPNKMIMGETAAHYLRIHPDVVGRFQYTSGGAVTLDQLAGLFDMEPVVISASNNTANEGATATMADLLGKHIVLAHISDEAGSELPTAITMFSWDKYDPNPAGGGQEISTFRDWDPDGEWLRVMAAFDTKITANDLGVMLLSAVA